MTLIRRVGFFEPDAIVLHPTDFQTIRLLTDANGQYYGGGPFTGAYGNDGVPAADMLWGKIVVKTVAIPQGTALIGAFKIGCEIYRRQGLTIEMTNTEGSDFTSNLITIRCETRLASAVVLPLAFCTVSGL
jgi:HK97 family phage major capsid protein